MRSNPHKYCVLATEQGEQGEQPYFLIKNKNEIFLSLKKKSLLKFLIEIGLFGLFTLFTPWKSSIYAGFVRFFRVVHRVVHRVVRLVHKVVRLVSVVFFCVSFFFFVFFKKNC